MLGEEVCLDSVWVRVNRWILETYFIIALLKESSSLAFAVQDSSWVATTHEDVVLPELLDRNVMHLIYNTCMFAPVLFVPSTKCIPTFRRHKSMNKRKLIRK
jgi:hypothetical protein